MTIDSYFIFKQVEAIKHEDPNISFEIEID